VQTREFPLVYLRSAFLSLLLVDMDTAPTSLWIHRTDVSPLALWLRADEAAFAASKLVTAPPSFFQSWIDLFPEFADLKEKSGGEESFEEEDEDWEDDEEHHTEAGDQQPPPPRYPYEVRCLFETPPPPPPPLTYKVCHSACRHSKRNIYRPW
jgi:hypothetical protein